MSTNLELWRERITCWKTGNQSRKEFCRENGLQLSSFDYWQRQIKKLDQPEQPLVRMTNPVLAITAEPIILQTYGGYRLEIPARFNVESLKNLLNCIRSLG